MIARAKFDWVAGPELGSISLNYFPQSITDELLRVLSGASACRVCLLADGGRVFH
jgi:hypothetical protein